MSAWLSPRGAIAALAVGAAVTLGAGLGGLALLFLFLLTSSALTPGGGRREPVQVAANGGVAALAALLAPLHPAWKLALAGALAAAAADTWSTEIGVKSSALARLITTGRPVPAGTSGGVTLVGSLGGAAGAALMAFAAAILGVVPAGAAPWIAAGGITGGVADSLLGATLQARWRCASCGALGETRRHECGGTGELASGMRWITNDTVNFLATLIGAAVGSAPATLRLAALPY